MNRSGRPVPVGPAITPQASSGWSARACAMTWSSRPREIVSMPVMVIGNGLRGSRQGQDQALLQVGQPLVDPGIGRTGIVGRQLVDAAVEVVGDSKAHAEREPHVIERAQPRLRLL